jgi:predicted transcriptional regulator
MATVGEIMSRDLLTVEPGAAIADVVRQMHEREVGAVLVLTG